MKITNYIFVLFGGMMFFLTSCSGEAEWRSANGAVWGTEYHIKYKAEKELTDSIVAEMQRIDDGVSIFNKESNISKINSGETDSVGREFAELFIRSKRMCAISKGAFDPTVCPLVELWGFGSDSARAEAPDSAMVEYVRQRVGMDDCCIDAHGRLVRKNPRTQFDFGAIAKGYGVDAVAEMLERNGCNDYMVEVGGEVRVRGLNGRGEKWHLQIDDPVESGQTGHKKLMVVELTDCSVATSGNYRNLRELPDGRRVWHTISPITGYPVASSTLSVTVVAPTCTTADAMATACMAMSISEATKLVEIQHGVSALFVVDNGKGGVESFAIGEDIFK